MDNDPIVSSQCYNIPRGIVEAKPKPITEIAARLRFLSCAIFEAYTSVDGKHVDYRSIHGSEEFARFDLFYSYKISNFGVLIVIVLFYALNLFALILVDI